MRKVIVVDATQIEEMIQESAETVFDQAVSMIKEHGVCYMRFTRKDGISLLDPKYNKQINGIISNA